MTTKKEPVVIIVDPVTVDTTVITVKDSNGNVTVTTLDNKQYTP